MNGTVAGLKVFTIKRDWGAPEITEGLEFLQFGWGNGYVVLPQGHSCHGKHYDDIEVQVHGGLTFGEFASSLRHEHWREIRERNNLEPTDYIVGFDTAHWGDNQTNWTEEAVQQETIALAIQLSKM